MADFVQSKKDTGCHNMYIKIIDAIFIASFLMSLTFMGCIWFLCCQLSKSEKKIDRMLEKLNGLD